MWPLLLTQVKQNFPELSAMALCIGFHEYIFTYAWMKMEEKRFL